MHLTYVYIGSGKNGNAVPWGRMKKEQDSRRNPDGFRQKVPVELKVCGTRRKKMKQGKSAGEYPLVYNRRKSRTCGKTGVNCE